MQGNILELNEVIDNIGLEPGEILKEVEDWPGYFITNYGRVLCTKEHLGTKWRWLKTELTRGGYRRFSVHTNGKHKHLAVHREVAKAFVDGWSEEKNIVNHLDENSQNNRAENLEWCNQTYNINYGTRTIRASQAKNKQVAQYTLDGQLVKIWPSASEASHNGFGISGISYCCSGKIKSHKGYKWRYINGAGAEKLN